MYKNLQKKVLEQRTVRLPLPADGSRRLAQESQGLQARPELRHELRGAGNELGNQASNVDSSSTVPCESIGSWPHRRAQRARAKAVDWHVPASSVVVIVIDLSRSVGRHLLHRPRHPHRPGAGHPRRPRAARVVARTRELLGFNCRSIAILVYVKDALTGNFGTSVLTTNPVIDGYPPRLSGDRGTCDRRHADRRSPSAFRSACSRRSSAAASPTRSCASSASSAIQCRSSGWRCLSLLLFYAWLRWVACPGRIDIVYEYSFTPITGFSCFDACGRAMGRLPDVFRHISCRACSAISRSPIQPHDALLHAERTAQEYIVAARAKGFRSGASSGAMRCATQRCRWSR